MHVHNHSISSALHMSNLLNKQLISDHHCMVSQSTSKLKHPQWLMSSKSNLKLRLSKIVILGISGLWLHCSLVI